MCLNNTVSIASLMILFVLTFTPLSSQTWKYNTGGNPFDGEYKIAYVVGTSNDRLYDSPTLYVRKYDNESEIDVFLTNIGFSGYVSSISYVFNNEEVNNISSSCVSEGKGDESIFISDKREKYEYPYKNYCEFDLLDFINQLSQKSYVDIRLNKDGDSNYDCRFRLSGSQKAINWVLGSSYLKNTFKLEKQINEINTIVDSLDSDYVYCYNFLEYTLEDIIERIKETKCNQIICFERVDSIITSTKEELKIVEQVVQKSNKAILELNSKIQSSSNLNVSNNFYDKFVEYFNSWQTMFPTYYENLNKLESENNSQKNEILPLIEQQIIENQKRLDSILIVEIDNFKKSINRLIRILDNDTLIASDTEEETQKLEDLSKYLIDFKTLRGLLYFLKNDNTITGNIDFLRESFSSILSNPNYKPFFNGNIWNHSLNSKILNSERDFNSFKPSLVKLFEYLELNKPESDIIIKKIEDSFNSY